MNYVEISLLRESELLEAEKLLRFSFGTLLGLKEPMDFGNGAKYMPRWYQNSIEVFAAKTDGKLVGCSMVANWGTCAGFGPLVVHPNYWNQGIGSRLIDISWSKFDEWKSQQVIFCTHPNSPKHIYLYGKFGAEPRFLIAICAKIISPMEVPKLKAQRYSQLSLEQQQVSLNAAYQLTNKTYEGLDWRSEMLFVQQRSLGETLLIWDDTSLIGLAICHYGTESEAETESCYVKLAVADSAEAFEQLVDQCEAFTATIGMSSLMVGVDMACIDAYHRIMARKFRLQQMFVSMHKPNRAGYSRHDAYVIEDRR